MNFRKTQEKLAGRFTVIRNDEEQLIVHCFGALGRLGVTQEDVDFICNFYMTKPTENWLRQETADAGDSFYIIIYKETA